jgi:hypothetical protein
MNAVNTVSSAGTPAFKRFRLRDINPVSGRTKVRTIGSPNRAMRDIHRRLVSYLRGLGVQMPNSTACRPGQSAVKNILRHRKGGKRSFNRYFVLLDIRSAYQAVRIDRMMGALTEVSSEIASSAEETKRFLLNNFFDESGGLVTGGPASPDLFNLYCEVHIDRVLRETCKSYGIIYTRYLDDLTFSSQVPIGQKKRRAIRRIIESCGFQISDRKAQTIDLRKGPVTVNGVGITLEGRLFLPRRTLDHIRGLLHVALSKGSVKPAVIHGKMGLLGMVIRFNPQRTESERQVLEMYREFRQKQRELRAGRP